MACSVNSVVPVATSQCVGWVEAVDVDVYTAAFFIFIMDKVHSLKYQTRLVPNTHTHSKPCNHTDCIPAPYVKAFLKTG